MFIVFFNFFNKGYFVKEALVSLKGFPIFKEFKIVVF